MEGKIKKSKKILGNKYFRRANDELKVLMKSIGRDLLSLISANEQKEIPGSENLGSNNNSNISKKELHKDICLLRGDIKQAIDMTAGMAQTLTNVFNFLRGNQAPNDERVGIAVPQQINDQDHNEEEEQNDNNSQDGNHDQQQNFTSSEDQEQNEAENDNEEHNDADSQEANQDRIEQSEGDNEENGDDQRQDKDQNQSQKQENDDSDSQNQSNGSNSTSTEQDEEQMIVANGEDNVLMSTENGQEFCNIEGEDDSNTSGSSYEESPTSEDSERRSGMERSPSPADVHFAATRGPIMFDKPGSRGQKCLTVSPMVDGHVISRAFVVIEKLRIPEGYTTVPVSDYEKDTRITLPVPRLGLPQTVKAPIETGSLASQTKCAKKITDQVREKRKNKRRKCRTVKTSPSRTYSCPVAIAAPFNINVCSPQKVVRCTRSSSRFQQQQQQQQHMEVEAQNEEEAMEIGNDSDESSRATQSDQPGPSWAHDF